MAALDKRWVGTTSTYTTATNWAAINLTKPTYKWTASGSGTNEYYMELTAGGNPGISAPGAVYVNSAVASSGSAGSLAAGTWAYGDNDTLGYSTVYVRLADGTDPNTKAIGYVQMYQVPVATDNVRIPAGSGAIDGVDQSSVAIGDFVVEDGYTAAIGSATAPLIIDPDRFEWSGGGRSYIDLYSANISPDIIKTAAGGVGLMGLYLKGSNLSTVTVYSGTVGLAWLFGNTATVSAVRVVGANANVYVGKSVTLTTSYIAKGKLYQHCGCTTANVFGGTYTTEESGAITTVNADLAATLTLNSTGAITTLNMQAGFTGTVDFSQSAEARAVTTLNHKAGALLIDTTLVSVTTRNTGDSKPQKIVVSAAA